MSIEAGKNPLLAAAGLLAKGFLERREIEKRDLRDRKGRLTASAAFLGSSYRPLLNSA